MPEEYQAELIKTQIRLFAIAFPKYEQYKRKEENPNTKFTKLEKDVIINEADYSTPVNEVLNINYDSQNTDTINITLLKLQKFNNYKDLSLTDFKKLAKATHDFYTEIKNQNPKYDKIEELRKISERFRTALNRREKSLGLPTSKISQL